ncbi:ATP-binding cassette sub-family G member 1-like [Amphibalanus amphitrite]|uniref:ATP-binding cassette sub-family G member 1-like n=1 Tax=Amphibalanus amphitrite TaxID=1232801 RepID=UPI001C8FDE23|nr:ATP-binding cassette sub-family G member 1-like [Amphibalanus amphitrite]
MDCTKCVKKVKHQRDLRVKMVTSPKKTSQVVRFTEGVSAEELTQPGLKTNGSSTGVRMFHRLPKSQPIKIEFDDLTYTVAASRRRGQVTRERKTILDGVTGVFRPGQLTAIMGPSGAGKSTLLNILAGYRVRNVEGSIRVNGTARSLQTFRKIQAYIMQDDHLLPHLSVDEAMMAAANLKLGPGFTHHGRRQVIDDVLEALGLSSSRSTRCVRLSGGQKKRLSIALELLNNPPVMFFDEPTSGLDSNSCSSCVSLLKTLAEGGRTIICTIHQPSSRLFQQFDQLYILARGSCIYRGTRPNLVPALAAAGLHCPGFHNPADFVMEAASGEYGDWITTLVAASRNGKSTQWTAADGSPAAQRSLQDTCHSTDETQPGGTDSISNGAAAAVAPSGAGSALTEPASGEPSVAAAGEPGSSSLLLGEAETGAVVVSGASQRLDAGREPFTTSATTQFCVLLKRTCRSIIRDRMLTMSRLASHVLFGLMIGSLYLGIGNEAKSAYNNAAQLFFAVMFLLFGALMSTILTFPLEMSVMKKEYMNCWYSVKSYYLAKTVADLPFQIVFPLIYDVIVYFMTSQPMELDRFCMFCLMTILTALVAQSVGLVIGAFCDIQLAVFLGPITMIPIILFSGFFVNLSTVPVWLSWLSYLSYARYSFEGLMLAVYGFDREDMHCSVPFCHYRSPKKFLKELDMLESDYWTDVLALSVMTVLLRLVGYFVLRYKLKLER